MLSSLVATSYLWLFHLTLNSADELQELYFKGSHVANGCHIEPHKFRTCPSLLSELRIQPHIITSHVGLEASELVDLTLQT